MAAADNGDGFKFWHSYYEALSLMGDAEAGHFVKALCAYVFDDVEPTFSSEMERFGFTLIADQCVESKRLTAQAKSRGRKSGESRRKKSEKQKQGTQSKAFPKSVPNVSRYVSSSFQEEEEGAADAGPKGPPPPLPEIGGGDG